MIKKTLIALLPVFMALIAMSCGDETIPEGGNPDPYPNYGYETVYCTITGNATNGYVLIGDRKSKYYQYIVYLAKGTNLGKLTENGNDRAIIYFRYDVFSREQMTDGTIVYHDAEFLSGEKLPVSNIVTMQQAQDAGMFMPDSCVEIDSTKDIDIWGYGQYITVKGTYQAAAKKTNFDTLCRPISINLVWDEEHSTDNILAVRLIYNRHPYFGYDLLEPRSSNNTFLLTPLSDWLNSHDITSIELRSSDRVVRKYSYFNK